MAWNLQNSGISVIRKLRITENGLVERTLGDSKMKTESIMVQNLCVPCGCRCRYCLLSWDGKPVGVSWEQGIEFGKRFITEAKELRPDLTYTYAFGYSMEHPHLQEAIQFLKEIGSPQAELLQCDGMKIRDEKACREFTAMLAGEGVKLLNFTFYGIQDYHNSFAGRPGDFEGMLRMIKAATEAGLEVSAGIPVTSENVNQVDELISILNENSCQKVSVFIPHEEGRGKSLAPVRLREKDLDRLSDKSRALLNRKTYRTEREWITASDYEDETKRLIIVSLTSDSIEHYKDMNVSEIIAEIESLDDEYYKAFPSFSELAKMYGNVNSDKLYRQRDLFYHYRQLYVEEHAIKIYDVSDERQSGSRRY
jgi:sulfatase maturation enzyme AslB (radical SAM superfamily)